MAEETLARPAAAAAPARSSLGIRLGVALGLVVLAAALYWALGAAGVLALPRSVDALASNHSIGRGRVLVTGYYIALPFVSYGGPKLPPYVFAGTTQAGAPAIHVTPTLEDLHAGRIAAIVDTATGDGSRWSPYVIHSVMSASAFSGVAVLVAVVALLLAFVLAGPLSERLVRARLR